MIHISKANSKLKSMKMFDAISNLNIIGDGAGTVYNNASFPAIPAEVVAREKGVSHSKFFSGFVATIYGLLLNTNSLLHILTQEIEFRPRDASDQQLLGGNTRSVMRRNAIAEEEFRRETLY